MSTSDTRNVKLGVCVAFLDGVDLGLTKGGVEVSVTTETHKVQVDQFGKSVINENIMGREVKAKVPLAETTIENMVRIMPGATLSYTGGTKASGTILLATNPTAGQNLSVNGKLISFVASGAVAADLEVNVGASAAATAANLRALLDASTDPAISQADYSVATATVTVTAKDVGVSGNAITLNAGTSGATVSGATLAGGAAPTAARVDVGTGIGIDLLSIAKELRLHPKGKPLTDKSDDFVIPLAATAGALTFAYKLDEERIYNVEFMGYPDTTTEKLFHVGDEAAGA